MGNNKDLKVLIVEDEPVSRKLLEQLMQPYAKSQSAVNGQQAFMAFISAMEKGEPFDLICLDIILPEIDGGSVLNGIRKFEADRGIAAEDGVKVVFTTALMASEVDESKTKHVTKPLNKGKVETMLRQLDLLS